MNDRPQSETLRPRQDRGTDMNLLGIYLNDHLAGATAGAARARHLARACQDSALASRVDPVAAEIAEDRRSLLGIMRRLDVPVRRYKVCAGWMAEKAGRLKGNGRIVRRSPLSSLLELELLRVGVEGKEAAWETLRRLADTDERLDPRQLDDLLERAGRQQGTLEDLRRQQTPSVFQHA